MRSPPLTLVQGAKHFTDHVYVMIARTYYLDWYGAPKMNHWPRRRARQVLKSEYGAAALQAHPSIVLSIRSPSSRYVSRHVCVRPNNG